MNSTKLQSLKQRIQFGKKVGTKVGLFAAVMGLTSVAVMPANAFQIEVDEDGELSGSLNTIMSFGAQFRMQERDADIVGKANNDPRFEEELAINRIREYENVPGLWSVNGDDGNLNYDQYDITYAVAKITSDLNLSYEDFSFRAGWSFYFDEVNRNFKEQRVSRFYREDNTYDPATDGDCLSSSPANPCFETNRPKDIEDATGYNFFLYDLNLSYDFEVAEKFVTLRVGRQGVNWGESTFLVLGSINSVNPPNAYRLRIPGGDLKEIFKPVNMVFMSIGLTDNTTMEAFYQLKWDRIDPDPVGSFFGTSDVAGVGGDFGMLSFVEPEDPNNEKDGDNAGTAPTSPNNVADDPSLAALGQVLAVVPTGRAVEVIKTNNRLQEFADQLESDLDSCGGDLNADVQCSPETIEAIRNARTDPRDEGQYGFKVAHYAEDLNGGTDLGFYFLNIHSRLPYASFIGTRQTAVVDLPAVLGGLGLPNQIPQPTEIFNNADTLKIFLEYPEDIQYYGLSYSTNVGDWAVSGELVYRPDYPFQVHTSDLTYAALAPAFGTSCLPEQGVDGTPDSGNTPDGYGGCTGASRSVNRISVPSFVEIYREGADADFTTSNYSQLPRQVIRGYEELDTLQYDMTFLALPGTNPFGADTWLVLAEAGFTKVMDMPDKSELQFAGAGDDTPFSRSAEEAVVANGGVEGGDSGPAALQALLVQNPDREQAGAFADDFSWGVRFISLLTYNDLLLGFNVEPLTGFFWDVNGTSPGPGGNFIEDRKTIFQGIRFNKGNWSGEMRYTWYTGANERNAERDRDNLFLQFTYSF